MAGLIGIGQSALSAAYAQLQTTGHSIANVNTPGYVRQEAILESAGGMVTGAGFIGRGVNVADVARRYDQFIARELSTSTALAAGDAARAKALGQLDSLLADTNNGLGVAMDDLRSAIGDLVNRPGDASTREVVIRRAAAMAEHFRATSSKLGQLGTAADLRIDEGVAQVNGKLQAIANLNQQIAATQGSGKQPSDMLDERDKLIDEVAASLQLTRLTRTDGTVSLYSAAGHALVVGNTASRLATQADPLDAGKLQLVFQVSGTRIAANASSLGTGELAGLVRFRDQDLASAQTKLGQLAAGVAGAYNKQQALGLDAQGNAGAALFGPMAARAVPAAGNNGNMALDVAIGDPSQLRATDYRLSFDGSNYQLESLANGSVATLAGLPATIDGLEISVASGAMTIGDRITIKGASGFASQMSPGMADGRGLATGYPASVQFGDANTGSVGLDAFAQSAVDGNAGQAVTITFTSANTFDVTGVGTGNPSSAKTAFAAESGVNLDEEAARLLQYQQAYQAAARVIATANAMFDTVLSMVSR